MEYMYDTRDTQKHNRRDNGCRSENPESTGQIQQMNRGPIGRSAAFKIADVITFCNPNCN